MIRYMRKEDVEAVAECEFWLRSVVDPDFGTKAPAPYAWTQDSIINKLRQYKNDEEGICEVRAWVAESADSYGAIIVEFTEDDFEILLLTYYPTMCDCRLELLSHLIEKAKKSQKRHRITCHVPDGDDKLLSFLKEAGFTSRLKRSYFKDGLDAWFCELPV